MKDRKSGMDGAVVMPECGYLPQRTKFAELAIATANFIMAVFEL
jgi:hypothetical protein